MTLINKIKAVLFSLCAVLLVFATIMATFPYLTDTDEASGTVAVGKIDIELTEGETSTLWSGAANGTMMLFPGSQITFNPRVLVKVGSVACYLFVKLKHSNATLMTDCDVRVADGWTALDGVDGVYYRVIDATTADTYYSIYSKDTWTMNTSVTAAELAALSQSETVTITAYAIQRDYLPDDATATTAWALLNP